MHNFSLADLVNRLNLGGAMHIKSIKVKYTDLTLKILIILYQNGIIRSFAVEENDSPMQIIVFFKYYQFKSLPQKFKLFSTPGKRVYWSLSKLNNKFSTSNFSGFFYYFY